MYAEDKAFFSYKGKPLVRKGNEIYYGSMMDSHVVYLRIIDMKKTVDGTEVPNKILLQLMKTDQNINPQDIIVKKGEKTGLYNALDVASIWLERSLEEK